MADDEALGDNVSFFSGSSTSKPEILWLLENARMALFIQDAAD